MACTAYSCQAMATRDESQPPPSRLSKAVVVDRALTLADTQGLDALTIRRLAQDLGVTPMALYWHFRSKEELLAALGDRFWEEVDVNVDPDADWIAQLRGLMESVVGMLRAHPSASSLLLAGQKLHGEASMQATEVALATLERGGFDPVYASEIARTALWTGLMLVMSEPGSQPRVAPEVKAEHLRQEHVRLAMLPPDRFPHLVAAAGPMTNCDPELHYKLGIDLFIGGVARLSEDV